MIKDSLSPSRERDKVPAGGCFGDDSMDKLGLIGLRLSPLSSPQKIFRAVAQPGV